jgi:hypothetical protein
MAISFEQIEPDFTGLRDFVLNDLDAITAQAVGGNYAAAAIIASHVRRHRRSARRCEQVGEGLFRETLPEPWRPVAPRSTTPSEPPRARLRHTAHPP